MRRDTSTVSNAVGFAMQMQNASASNLTYASFLAQISDNTAGSEDANFLLQIAVAGTLTTRFSVNATGFNSAGVGVIASGTATPAGGSTSARLLFGTTAGFGIYYGSGAPTVSAAQGSIYLRSDGSSTSTRLYVNTNGSTTWTNFTSAA
jgi:hypothetical protein